MNRTLEGKVAIITGAGRGIGRAHALLFAQRGAKVVVNDLGTAIDGTGFSSAVAQGVVDEITAAGGAAVANGDDVSTPAGGRHMAQQALDSYGRVDIVLNNAGICRDKVFAECSLEDFEIDWRIHVGGHVNVTGAAWPHMVKQHYGRVIMTGSGAGLFGLNRQATYAAAKGAILGLMRTLAIEGAEHGIVVNAIYPGGVSRMHEEAFPDPAVFAMMGKLMPPELVAPAAAWMASDACTTAGHAYSVWGGRVVRLVIGSGHGYVDRALTPEAVGDHWEEIASTEDLFEPTDGVADVAHWQGAITAKM